MDIDADLKNPKFKTWVRGAKGLQYLQEGLETFIGDHVVKHRDKTVQTITSVLQHGSVAKCKSCTLENLLPEHAAHVQCTKQTCKQNNYSRCFGSKQRGRRICPRGLCSKLYDEIVDTHQFKNPMWQNTDPSTWCSDPFGWSYAKCFQTTPNHGSCSNETDVSGLLSIIINDTFFQNEVDCSLVSNPNVFTSALNIRNEIMHRAKMELEETELQTYITIFIAVLTDQKTLLNDPVAIQSVGKLEKLKSNQTKISLSDEIKLIQVRKEALLTTEKLEKKEKDIIENIEKKKQDSLAEIEGAKLETQVKMRQAVEEFKEATLDFQGKKQEVHRELASAKSEIQIGRQMALKEIGGAKEAALNELQEAKAEASEHTAALHQAVREAEEAITQLTVKQQQLGKNQISTIKFEASAGTTSKIDSSQEERQDQAYLQMKTNLEDDLITFYRHNHRTIRLSPLLEEEAPLLKYYVTPVIKLVKIKRAHGSSEEERIPVISLHDMFYREGKVCSEVYLSADAGLGKTFLSKRLALTWCQAKKPVQDENDHFSDKDLTAMNEFDFLFFLLLRDCSNICDIDGMILQQNISRLAHSLSDPLKDLENILSRERCLIILDGLDEWLHPPEKCNQGWSNLPHQKTREYVTVLTTTRPWKLSVLGSESSQLGHFEIFGLNQDSAATLKESVLSHLFEKSNGRKGNEEEIDELVSNFNEELQKTDISGLEASPLLLMYLLFVWFYYKKLGNTQCEIYSDILELLLSRTVQKPTVVKEVIYRIPHCFNKLELCRHFYGFLTSLGKLAFVTLLKETKENTLVFDRIEAEQNLDNESLSFCLNSGILTQNKEYENLLRRTTKMSFSHKSMQEYFAALYMCSSPEQSVLETMKSKCKCIKDILEISKMLLFISGINADTLALISRELIIIVNKNEITRKYRSSTKELDFHILHPLQQYQNMWVSCCKEMSQENQGSLCFEDVFIEDIYTPEHYRENLRLLLTTQNQQNIKSVYIAMHQTSDMSTFKVSDYFPLTGLDNLEKIWFRGEYVSDVAVLLKTSVRCLYLHSKSLDSPLPCKEVTCLSKLEVIDIGMVSLSHSELTEFYNYISRTKSLREINLLYLHCTDDHEWYGCPGNRLEFLQQSQLSTLSLRWLSVTEVEINLAILDKFELENVYNRYPVLKFRNQPAADSNLPENTHVQLELVTMAASSLCQLVDVVQKLQQSVRVEITKCTIEPEDECRRQIDRIKASSQFRMLKELEEDRFGWKTFKFQTIQRA